MRVYFNKKTFISNTDNVGKQFIFQCSSYVNQLYWNKRHVIIYKKFFSAFFSIPESQGCAIPAVREHEQTTLNRYFDRDVGLDQKSVKVLHYGSNSDGINIETNYKRKYIFNTV